MVPTTSYASIHEDYVAAIEWMKGLGVNLQAGRTQHYERVLRHWKDAYRTATAEEGQQMFPDFVSSMSEIYEFVNIHKAFASVEAPLLKSIVEKLRKGVNGPINATDETPNSTAARNFLFEAGVAAKAHKPGRGVEAILDARSDTGIRIGQKKLWVECKRVTSIDKLEQNLRKACSQLAQVLASEVGSGHRGIVAMDISKLLNRGDMIYVSNNDQQLVSSVQRMLDTFIAEHEKLWARIYARKDRKIIGTIFRMSFMASSEARNILVHSMQWGLSPAPGISDADFQMLRKLAQALDSSE